MNRTGADEARRAAHHVSKKTRSRGGVEKKAKLRRRAGKLRKRAWDLVDMFRCSGSGVVSPSFFGWNNERARRWAMHNRNRWWKKPRRGRGRQVPIDWEGIFDWFATRPAFTEAVRRRLLEPAPTFAPEYGLPLSEMLLTPGEIREIEMFGQRGTLRMVDHEMAEIVLVERAQLKAIDMTIGFVPPQELAPDPVDLTVGSLDVKGARTIVPTDGDPDE
jgi:hypothetical protein